MKFSLCVSVQVDDKELSLFDLSLPLYNLVLTKLKEATTWLPTLFDIKSEKKVILEDDLSLSLEFDQEICREQLEAILDKLNQQRDDRVVVYKNELPINFSWRYQSESIQLLFYLC